MALLAERENSELISEPSMRFWGITCKANKQYEQLVGARFRITMAVLDPESMPNAGSDKTVSLLVKHGQSEYLLCVLKHGEIHQVNLNLIFNKGEYVFFTKGHGDVCLSGYAQNDGTEYLCPLVEVIPSKNQLPKSPLNVEPESVTPEKEEENSGSKKRKLEDISQLLENGFNEADSSDSDVASLPTDDTPTPMKAMENSSENKMSKKKKKLNESNSFEKSVDGKSLKSAKSTPSKNTVVKLEGGVEIQDIIIGRGRIATKGDMVHVFYVGRFRNKRIFDSRLPGKRPFSFKLGASQVIKGWDVGLQGMKVGGRRKLKVPPHMGYGSSQIEGIPPNSTLFFSVELHDVRS